ncbi:MAG: hypothetical protein AAF533_02930 [Acidobacteriota bacterium]
MVSTSLRIGVLLAACWTCGSHVACSSTPGWRFPVRAPPHDHGVERLIARLAGRAQSATGPWLEGSEQPPLRELVGPSLREEASLRQLQADWTRLLGPGAVQVRGPISNRSSRQGWLVGLMLTASKTEARLTAAVDGADCVVGLTLETAEGLHATVGIDPRELLVDVRELSVRLDKGGAMLTLPKGDGPWPAVVLDSTPLASEHALSRELALGLAARGVAVLRRPAGGSPWSWTLEDGLRFLIDHPEVRADRLFLAGELLTATTVLSVPPRDGIVGRLLLQPGEPLPFEEYPWSENPLEAPLSDLEWGGSGEEVAADPSVLAPPSERLLVIRGTCEPETLSGWEGKEWSALTRRLERTWPEHVVWDRPDLNRRLWPCSQAAPVFSSGASLDHRLLEEIADWLTAAR